MHWYRSAPSRYGVVLAALWLGSIAAGCQRHDSQAGEEAERAAKGAPTTAQQAESMTTDATLVKGIQERTELYKQGKPWRDKALTKHAKEPLTVHLNIRSP